MITPLRSVTNELPSLIQCAISSMLTLTATTPVTCCWSTTGAEKNMPD